MICRFSTFPFSYFHFILEEFWGSDDPCCWCDATRHGFSTFHFPLDEGFKGPVDSPAPATEAAMNHFSCSCRFWYSSNSGIELWMNLLNEWLCQTFCKWSEHKLNWSFLGWFRKLLLRSFDPQLPVFTVCSRKRISLKVIVNYLSISLKVIVNYLLFHHLLPPHWRLPEHAAVNVTMETTRGGKRRTSQPG